MAERLAYAPLVALIVIFIWLAASPASNAPPPGAERAQDEGSDPARFVPSERVPADTAVAFPVDI